MPKRAQLSDAPSVDELAQRYRQETDLIARSHGQIIWLLMQGRTTTEVAASTGYSLPWIHTLVQRYNRHGPADLGDRRHANPGAQTLLSPALHAALDQALDGPAPDGGVWTSAKVAAWISACLGRPVHVARGWEWLQRLSRRPRVPPAAPCQGRPGGASRVQKSLPNA